LGAPPAESDAKRVRRRGGTRPFKQPIEEVRDRMHFTSPTWGVLTLDEVTTHIRSYLREDQHSRYKLVIGTDSHTDARHTDFVTALIVHRVGRGARFFFRKIHSRRIPDLRHRIYRETELSLELIELLKKHGITDLLAEWPVEIHLDIGQQGETRMLIQEIVGWVTSVGYTAKIKPHSFGASSVADRFTGG
jgi:hypothetical protein